MKSKTAKKILSETSKETVDKVREAANELVLKEQNKVMTKLNLQS